MNETTSNEEKQADNAGGNGGDSSSVNGSADCCYNQVLDDEIRLRLDKLNALSDLINSLERQFDEANSLFRDTLKCSTNRLSTIAKTLGSKSIRQGRIYHATKLSVEQSQTDCQKACVQFEQANKEHQIAKEAIRQAELKLLEANGADGSHKVEDSVIALSINGVCESIDMQKMKLTDNDDEDNIIDDDPIQTRSEYREHKQCSSSSASSCDTNKTAFTSSSSGIVSNQTTQDEEEPAAFKTSILVQHEQTKDSNAQETKVLDIENNEKTISPTITIIKHATLLSEELNQANTRLIEAEKRRCQSEKYHLDQANKLMIAQEKLTRMEREHGQSIRRSRLYFDEAKKFDAKLNSVKGDICRISEDILAAKQAYARTLSELEQFSDDLHDSSNTIETS